MSRESIAPSTESLQSLLDIILPGSTYLGVHPLEGDFSNSTHLVDAKSPDGSVIRLVTRRYAVFGDYDRGEKTRREFKTLQLLRNHGCPGPEPVYLDDTGTVLGSPGIVTYYVSGKLILSEPYPAEWAEKRAKTLADIHTIPIHDPDSSFLLDANREALWFLNRDNVIPHYVSNHPKGMAAWNAMLDYWLELIDVSPALVHIDYWAGNILWENGEISAVVDWEEAAQGDPGIDVAYSRMDMILSGMSEAADRFLDAYEEAVNKPVANLGFWELAAGIREMWHPSGWISESPVKERFADFIDGAIQRVDSL
jgi:aminoglycoside phosphotransferase (APT) family kinase protein